jgi:hypothetical protein
MLLAANPFTGPDFPALLLAICEASYRPPSTIDRLWPRSLDAWFVRSFRIDREHRFRSAEEAAISLAMAIAELGDTQPAGADNPSQASWPSSPGLPSQPLASWPGGRPPSPHPTESSWPSRPSVPYSGPPTSHASWEEDDEDDKTAPRSKR